MISTTARSPLAWPEEKRKHDQKQQFNSDDSDAQNDTSYHEKLDDTLGHAIETWLLHKYPPVSSESTAIIYRKLLFSLRSYLQSQGLDLDSPRNQITQQIQTWAHLRSPNSKKQSNVAPSTYNQRIAAIKSFYSWASNRGLYVSSNPAEKLSNTAVRKYAESRSLDVQQVCSQLKMVDRSTARGQRDYVLLQIALNTGRSARELAGLTWGNISLQGENITLTFGKGRNGKVMYDMLDSRLSQTLLVYLHTIYGEDLTALSPQAPIWISFSDRTYHQAIGMQTIADICKTHLGISKIHRLRHTFALTMDQLGAPVDTIQIRLGHESRSTTNAYLAGLKGAHNPYATLLATIFGLDAEYPQTQN